MGTPRRCGGGEFVASRTLDFAAALPILCDLRGTPLVEARVPTSRIAVTSNRHGPAFDGSSTHDRRLLLRESR